MIMILSWLCLLLAATQLFANPDAKRLYDDLLNGYNSMIRPVGNVSDRLTVKMGLRLSQLIDVNLKNQIMTTNVFVEHEWNDYKLKWDPEEYGGVTKLHVPSEQIWIPDLVLYNNADGNYEITIMTKAIIHHDGLVVWKPPAIYKSSCEIDIEYFPFDEQTCFMKFGTWTYDGLTVDLRHLKEKPEGSVNPDVVEVGMDLSAFYLSVEWDILAAPARRKVIFYNCCEEPYIDITYNLTLRRKTLFYTCNLIIPCVLISFLSILVFYLPADSGEKVSLSIMITLSLVVFFLLLVEIIPPTSLSVPLLGQYLLFTMTLVTFSSITTIAILNVNFRSPVTHRLAPWVKRVFIEILPKYLYIQRPPEDDDPSFDDPYTYGTSFEKNSSSDSSLESLEYTRKRSSMEEPIDLDGRGDEYLLASNGMHPAQQQLEELDTITPEVKRITTRIQFLSQHKKNYDEYIRIEDDWKFVAMVLDRLFLGIFTIACIAGLYIILRAPNLYNFQKPIDVLHTKIIQ